MHNPNKANANICEKYRKNCSAKFNAVFPIDSTRPVNIRSPDLFYTIAY